MKATQPMKRTILVIVLVCFAIGFIIGTAVGQMSPTKATAIEPQGDCWTPPAQEEFFPDGLKMDEWFHDYSFAQPRELGKSYDIRHYGVKKDSTLVQTQAIQAVIDLAAENGGGVVVVPKGTFLTGALFFRQGTHLYLAPGAKLKGSDFIGDYPILDTRIEGQSVPYFCALINADGLDGFTITGRGTIDGNGERYWKSFWLRRKWNPACTNKDEMRPRLVYVSNSRNVQISGVNLHNSPFWTTHLYRCENVKLMDLHIFAPVAPVKAPSSDAVDIDVCRNVLIKGCYIEVNDDGVALKGGKGPYADQAPENGSNENIVLEDCTYGFCHGVLTCGSESVHNRNIVVRRCQLIKANRLLWLKMRPDTPQLYEYILVEDITGQADNFLYIRPWTQFFDLQGRKDIPKSYARNICLRRINLDCQRYFNVEGSDQYDLSDFRFEQVDVRAQDQSCDASLIRNFIIE